MGLDASLLSLAGKLSLEMTRVEEEKYKGVGEQQWSSLARDSARISAYVHVTFKLDVIPPDCSPPTSYTSVIITMSARTDVEASEKQASSGITSDDLTATLKSKLDASHVEIQDLSGKPGPSRDWIGRRRLSKD